MSAERVLVYTAFSPRLLFSGLFVPALFLLALTKAQVQRRDLGLLRPARGAPSLPRHRRQLQGTPGWSDIDSGRGGHSSVV